MFINSGENPFRELSSRIHNTAWALFRENKVTHFIKEVSLDLDTVDIRGNLNVDPEYLLIPQALWSDTLLTVWLTDGNIPRLTYSELNMMTNQERDRIIPRPVKNKLRVDSENALLDEEAMTVMRNLRLNENMAIAKNIRDLEESKRKEREGKGKEDTEKPF